MVPKKDPNNHLEQKMKKLMKISTQTNQNVENIQQTISNNNDELRKTNENLSQLWIAAKEALQKARGNERRLNQLEKTKEQLKLDLKTELMNDLKESISLDIRPSPSLYGRPMNVC